MDLGLNGASVFVAASSDGLGAATARRFCLEGAQVAVNGRDPSRLEATASALRKESGQPVLALPGDVTDAQTVHQIIARAAAEFGGLDVLVVNAGGPPAGTFATVKIDAWERAFRLSVMSAVR